MIDCSPRQLRKDDGIIGGYGGRVAKLKNPRVVYQGVPEGNFVPPYVEVEGHPDNIIPVGEQIRLITHYRVSCPGQPWYSPEWTVAAKALGDDIAVKMGWTYMTGGEVTDRQYLNSPAWPIMPNKPVTLEVSLWGNPGAFQDLPLSDP